MSRLKKYGVLALVLTLFLTSCSSTTPTTNDTPAPSGDTDKKPSFVFVVTDQLGDKSFNDSAAVGTKRIASELGYETKIMEIGRDQTKWEPTILDLSESGQYTAIFLNGSGTQEIVEAIAPDFPDPNCQIKLESLVLTTNPSGKHFSRTLIA